MGGNKYIVKDKLDYREVNFIYRIFNRPIDVWDWAIFFSLLAFCFVTFLHGDILCTAGSSISYLGGHIKDFYEYNVVNGVEEMNNYMPSTYILFALWNIPIYILGLVNSPVYDVFGVSLFVMLWYKALPVIFYLATAFVLAKIGKLLGFGEKKIKLLVFIFLTAPLAFFSPNIFGQYDSFTVFFVVLGLYFYFKNDLLRFAVFFGIATTFKYFAFLIFLPLLLLRQKNIFKIFANCAIYIVPFLLEVFLYLDSKYFTIGVLNFKVTGYIFDCGLDLKYLHISLVLILWIVLVTFSYIKKFGKSPKDNEDLVRWAIFFCNGIVLITFTLSMWHPQWLIFAVPFMALGSVINKKANIFFILDGFIFFVFSILCVCLWRGSVDEHLMFKGIWKNFIDFDSSVTASMRDFLFFDDVNLLFSIFAGLFLVSTFFKHPKYTLDDFSQDLKGCNISLRFRLFSIFCFWVLPSLLSIFVSYINSSYYIVKNSFYYSSDGNIGDLEKNKPIRQYFKVPDGVEFLNEVRVCFSTGEMPNDGVFELSIKDSDGKNVIYMADFDSLYFKNILPTKFDIGSVPVKENELYFVEFCLKEKGKIFNSLSINKTKERESSKYLKTVKEKNIFGGEGAYLDKEMKRYNLCVDILGS